MTTQAFRGATSRHNRADDAPDDAGINGLMSLRSHIRLLRAGLPIIMPALLIALLAAAAISGTLPRRWTASATMYVGQSLTEPSFDYGGLLASQLLTPTYARLATAADLLEAVAEELDLDVGPEALAQRIETEVPVGGTLITLRATADSAEDAAALANAVAGELLRRAPAERSDQADLEAALAQVDTDIEATRQALLELLGRPELTPTQESTVTQLQQRLEALEGTRLSLSTQLASRSPNALTLIDEARAPQTPAGPSRTVIVATAGTTSLALTILFVYAIAGIRRDGAEPRPVE